jgi:protein SCO1/2
MKNYSYVGITFIILIFGIWTVYNISKYDSSEEFFISGQIPAFSFTNQYNNTVTNQHLDGKVYVVEFFFTTCPSICPIMNENMKKVEQALRRKLDFGIVSITINPEFDTPEVLKAYAEKYQVTHPNWHFLTGDREAIYKLANEGFKLYAASEEAAPGGFEHSGLFALIDKEGNIVSRYDSSGNPMYYYDGLNDSQIQMLIEDIQALLK